MVEFKKYPIGTKFRVNCGSTGGNILIWDEKSSIEVRKGKQLMFIRGGAFDGYGEWPECLDLYVEELHGPEARAKAMVSIIKALHPSAAEIAQMLK